MARNLTDFQLERLHLGEFSAKEEIEMKTRMSDEDWAYLQSLDASNDEILSSYPPGVELREIEAKMYPSTAAVAQTSVASSSIRSWLRGLSTFALAGGVVAAVCVGVVSMNNVEQPMTGVMDGVRLKGDGRVLVYKKSQTVEPKLLTNGALCQRGDLIQLGFITEPGHAVLLSFDGNGSTTLHWPENGQTAVDGGTKVLDFSLELDAAPKFERFVLVTSPNEIRIQDVMAQAKEVAQSSEPETEALQLSGGERQTSFLVRKP